MDFSWLTALDECKVGTKSSAKRQFDQTEKDKIRKRQSDKIKGFI